MEIISPQMCITLRNWKYIFSYQFNSVHLSADEDQSPELTQDFEKFV